LYNVEEIYNIVIFTKNGKKANFNRLSEQGKESFQRITDYFNTKWCDISPTMYFRVAHKIYKNLTHKQIFNDVILEKYKLKDRAIKINSLNGNIEDCKNKIIKEFSSIKNYCNKEYNLSMRLIVKDYIDNKISGKFILHCIEERLFRPTIPEFSYLTNIINKEEFVKEFKGTLLQSKSLSGSMLYGDTTRTNNENKKRKGIKYNVLNEDNISTAYTKKKGKHFDPSFFQPIGGL
jgi:hypothetical protein